MRWRDSRSPPRAASWTRTGPDCAAILQAMAEGTAAVTPLLPPPAPLGTLPLAPASGSSPLDGVTVALTDRVKKIPIDAEVARGYDEAVRACEKLGARLVELPAPWTFAWEDLSWVLMAEVWAYHRAHADRHDLYRAQVAEFVEAACNFTD